MNPDNVFGMRFAEAENMNVPVNFFPFCAREHRGQKINFVLFADSGKYFQ